MLRRTGRRCLWLWLWLAPSLAGARGDGADECESLLKEMKATEAVERCGEALRQNPRDTRARILKVRAHLALKDFGSGLAEAEAGSKTAQGEEAGELASWHGVALFKLRRFAEARARLEVALVVRPKDAVANLHLCQLHAMSGEAEVSARAATACQAFLGQHPDEPAYHQIEPYVMLWLGQAQIAAADAPAAVASCSRAEARLGRPQERALAQACQVEGQAAQGRCNPAVALGERVLAAKLPRVFEAVVGCYLGELRRPADAARVAQLYRATHPRAARAFLLSADAELASGHDEAALGHLDGAAALLPAATDKALALRKKGALLARMGRRLEAVRELDRAVALSPRDALSHYELGRALAASFPADQARALSALTSATTLDPACLPACLELGAMMRRLGRARDAILAHERCATLSHGALPAQLELGADQLAAGELDGAVTRYEGAAALPAAAEPRAIARAALVHGLLVRAAAQLRAGAAERAESDLVRVRTLDPGDERAIAGLAAVRLHQRRARDAVALLASLARRGPDTSLVHARALAESGELEQAARMLGQISTPTLEVALEHAAVLLALRRGDAAVAALGRVPGGDPKLPRARGLVRLAVVQQLASDPAAPPAALQVALEQARADRAALLPAEQDLLELRELMSELRGGRAGVPDRLRELAGRIGPARAEALLGAGGLDTLVCFAAYSSKDYDEAARLAQGILSRLGARAPGAVTSALERVLGRAQFAQGARALDTANPTQARRHLQGAIAHLGHDTDELRLARGALGFLDGKKEAARSQPAHPRSR